MLAEVEARAGASTAATVVAARAEATGARPGLVLLVRGGEDCRTMGWKLCPPRVFTMVGLEKEQRWRGGGG